MATANHTATKDKGRAEKHPGYPVHQAHGAALASNALNDLFKVRTQAEALPILVEFLMDVTLVGTEEVCRESAGGAAAVLVDVILTGLQAIRERA